MLLQRTGSPYGRLTIKPNHRETSDTILEENLTLQDQIENLRAKISLKERYNKVQSEEVEECRAGVSSMTTELWTVTNKLRDQLARALDLEKQAVRHALRTHRRFQLALSGKLPDIALAWLDDKVFDMSKRLNLLLDALACKRRKLQDSEDLVILIERSPQPGTLKWEVKAIQTCQQLEYAIDNMRVKLETARILHSKYVEIRNILEEERGHYTPALRHLEKQLNTQSKELEQLRTMLSEASVFQSKYVANLRIIEKQASEGRRRRRRLMARIKEATLKLMENNQEKSTVELAAEAFQDLKKLKSRRALRRSTGGSNLMKFDTTFILQLKKMEIENFQDKAKRLIDCMRVPDITHIPRRFQQVQHLLIQLKNENRQKIETRDFLLRQRDNLLLIHCHLANTGQAVLAEHRQSEASLQDANKDVKREYEIVKKDIHRYGETIIDVRLGLISLHELLDGTPYRKKRPANALNTAELIKSASAKITKLRMEISGLQSDLAVTTRFSLPVVEQEQTIATAKIVLPPRLIRVRTPQKQDYSDEEDYDDAKVPTREEIKARSTRISVTGKMRRGIQ